MQSVEHHHPAGLGLGLHALSLSLFQKAMRMPLLVCSPAERSKTTCASRDIQQKKACEGSSYALSSRAFTCPNYFNHFWLIYFSASANKTAVRQY